MIWRFRIRNSFCEIFKFRDFMNTLRNFAKSDFGHIFVFKLKYKHILTWQQTPKTISYLKIDTGNQYQLGPHQVAVVLTLTGKDNYNLKNLRGLEVIDVDKEPQGQGQVASAQEQAKKLRFETKRE